jgi:hypothetical protein
MNAVGIQNSFSCFTKVLMSRMGLKTCEIWSNITGIVERYSRANRSVPKNVDQFIS